MRRVFFNWAVLFVAALAPMTAMGGNQEMAESIATVLESKNLTEGCDIGLKFQNETVWLTGVVDDASKVEAIQDAIESLDGVVSVVNDLSVEKQVINDSAVKQASGYQQCAQQQALADIPGDEVVAAPTPAAAPAPAATPAATPIPAAPSSSTPLPLKKISYSEGQMAAAPAAAPAAASNSVMYGQQPVPMNPDGYNMRYRTSAAMQYDAPHLPRKAWPSYASYPNTAAVQYPKRHSAGVFPYIGPYYPYPQVPEGWRKVTLEWHDGYWHLDFDNGTSKGLCSGLFRMQP